MDYQSLANFIRIEMKMTHIYQPLMIKKLLESDNTATVEEIARVFLNNDEPLLDYYKERVLAWPKMTLKKRKVVKYAKNRFTLLVDDDITDEQRKRLIEMCESRCEEYLDKYQSRYSIMNNRIPIPSQLRSQVLQKTDGMCAMCRIEKPSYIDFILSVSLGGNNSLENLQALCHKCKIQKIDSDKKDFVKQKKMLKHRSSGCMFCNPKDIINGLELAVAVPARVPVAPIHVQILPKRHIDSFESLIPSERYHCIELIELVTSNIPNYNSSKFSVSFNINKSQDHFHIDLVSMLH